MEDNDTVEQDIKLGSRKISFDASLSFVDLFYKEKAESNASMSWQECWHFSPS